jgi:hypothetical protein
MIRRAPRPATASPARPRKPPRPRSPFDPKEALRAAHEALGHPPGADLVCHVMLPIRTVSEANAHEHWRKRAKRAKQQRGLAAMVLRTSGAKIPAPPLVVRITRIAPCALDDDNLAGSQKHVRDGIADWLTINDRDPRVQWVYAQTKSAPKSYAVRIEIFRTEST